VVSEQQQFESVLDLGATSALRLGEQRIQEGAAGIGVHLDQLGAIPPEVKIIAHEGAARSGIEAGDRWRPGQDRFLVCGQSRRGLDHLDDSGHVLKITRGLEDGNIGEEMLSGTDVA